MHGPHRPPPTSFTARGAPAVRCSTAQAPFLVGGGPAARPAHTGDFSRLSGLLHLPRAQARARRTPWAPVRACAVRASAPRELAGEWAPGSGRAAGASGLSLAGSVRRTRAGSSAPFRGGNRCVPRQRLVSGLRGAAWPEPRAPGPTAGGGGEAGAPSPPPSPPAARKGTR